MNKRRKIIPIEYYAPRTRRIANRRPNIAQAMRQNEEAVEQIAVQETNQQPVVDQLMQQAMEVEEPIEVQESNQQPVVAQAMQQPVNVHQTPETIAKKEMQIVMLKKTIQHLNTRIGIEDLTVGEMQLYEEILLSSSDESDGSDDSDDKGTLSNCGNNENFNPNIQPTKQTEMLFSFSHGFILNVGNLFAHILVSFRLIILLL